MSIENTFVSTYTNDFFTVYKFLICMLIMTIARNFFFGFVSLAMAVAASLQFYLVYELDDKCPESPISLAFTPLLAGGCLAGSFVANAIWLYTKMKQWDTYKRAALIVWTLSVLVGITAAGATLGQVQLYPSICTNLHTTSSDDFNALQYISIALLILSVVAPHGMEKASKPVPSLASQSAGGPVASNLSSSINLTKQPLVFV